jgi:hypothetical protein
MRLSNSHHEVTSPIMATIALAMMKGALALTLLENHTVANIEKLASAFGGTVILKDGTQLASTYVRLIELARNGPTVVPAMSQTQVPR